MCVPNKKLVQLQIMKVLSILKNTFSVWYPLLLQFFSLYDQILNSSYKFCFPLSVLQTDIKIVFFFNEAMSSSEELHCTYSSGYNFILEKSCQKITGF